MIFRRPFLICPSSSGYFVFMTQQGNQIADTFFHGTAIDDLVDCALLQQKFCTLETFRQGFAYSLLDNARTGKPISALGSAKTTSPKKAKLADTPPMVGSVNTEINGRRFSVSKCKAALVFVICIKELTPSCIRAPPEAATQINEQLSATARRTP